MTPDDDKPADARLAEIERLLEERGRLIHDLEVHQVELEAQNQQLREAQEQLEEARARYSDLYDFAPVAYCTLDRTGCVSEINLTGAAMLGKARGLILGKPFALYVSEADRPAFRRYLRRRLASAEGPMVIDLELASSTKRVVVIQMVSTAMRDRDGTIVACRSAFSDISEQKRSENALHVAVHMREDFLAIVSHDLRNPLNAIMLGSDLLRISPTASEDDRVVISRLREAATRMSRMLSDLLDLSSMDAGHLSMTRSVESVDSLLLTTVEASNSAAVAAGVHLETELGESEMTVYCDRHRVVQVLTNLVGNAIKFSNRGGEIHVAARRTYEEIEFVVTDTGAGIARAQLEHIFDPYWQATKTAKQGTGLGLSIARGIVEVHGGRIWAQSKLGEGTSFYFTLPSAPRHSIASESPRPRPPAGPLAGQRAQPAGPAERSRGDREQILIVDDEPDMRVLLTDLLRSHGFTVAAVSDGVAALAYLRKATTLPSLILLDLVMPHMNGWEFLEVQSHDERLARIPVVLTSGQVAARETAHQLGLAGFIEKPISAAPLLEIVAATFDRA